MKAAFCEFSLIESDTLFTCIFKNKYSANYYEIEFERTMLLKQ